LYGFDLIGSFILIVNRQPDKVCLTWTHRERKHSSKFGQWEPGLKSIYEGLVAWDQAYDLIEFDTTLYKSLNENSYEEKEWILLVENVN